MRNRAVGLAFLIGLLVLSGCGSGVYYTITPTDPTAPPPVATQSGSVSVAPQYAAVGPSGSSQFKATVSGSGGVQWLVNGVAGGNATVGTVDANGNFTAPVALVQPVNVVVTAELANSAQSNYATAVVSLVASGVVSATGNPQVASYSITLPAPGSVYVEFGDSAAYGFPTSVQTTPSHYGGQLTVLVAGLRGNTAYHMRAQVVLNDGAALTDTDHTFTTGLPPETAVVEMTTTAGDTPQPGIETFDTLRPHEAVQAFATDLSGNVIWTYSYAGSIEDAVQPIKMLPNGHFLIQISYASSIPVQKGGIVIPGTLDEVREVDLAGSTIRSVTAAQLAKELPAQGAGIQLGSLHHDVLPLPNGHILLLFSVSKAFNDLPGYPGTTNVLGDELVDVDQNFSPDWVWNSFDHLDVNRHPYLFPDWTHSNALLYSADDHNVLLSVRHQNWIIKIDFEDGTGSGNILWRLGEGGDFRLEGGTDPTDWFYAQHGPSFFSTNTTGVFELGAMDNGDDRQFPAGVMCGVGGVAPCLYSTASVLQVNESGMSASLLKRYVPPGSIYSFFGGNVNPLADGDLEVNFCGATTGTLVQELREEDGIEEVVWQAVTKGTNQYRADRLPSLYPGVQW
ncbi:aryl-sulfate sulfotransferase [Tunturiibacter gelidoferens]|uniref:Aryl-sulfate sulfotransferase n=1 Tax=Tunturiibacter gelidiferens TaxID=3069689 RepID=A0AAU7YVV9_9BACT